MKESDFVLRYAIVHKRDELSVKIANNLKTQINLIYDDTKPEVVITIGGDGTFIRACHKYPNAIFFGIHTGHLGFYSNYGVEDLAELVNTINSDYYEIINMPLLTVEVFNNTKRIYQAINEMTIICPPRTLNLDVYINDKFFEHFRGTGLCISTPTGSTAYNKSLGGAIIDHNLKVMQLTEIASINSMSYKTINSPLVLGDNYTIELKPVGKYKFIFLTIDNLSIELYNFKYLKAYLGNSFVRMATKKQIDFISRIKRSFLEK